MEFFSCFALSPRPYRPNKHSNVDQVQDQRVRSRSSNDDDDDERRRRRVKGARSSHILPFIISLLSEIKDCNLNISFSSSFYNNLMQPAIDWWLESSESVCCCRCSSGVRKVSSCVLARKNTWNLKFFSSLQITSYNNVRLCWLQNTRAKQLSACSPIGPETNWVT